MSLRYFPSTQAGEINLEVTRKQAIGEAIGRWTQVEDQENRPRALESPDI